MMGPAGALFEPKHYLYDTSAKSNTIGKKECEEGVVFKLKGFGLQVQVKALDAEGKLIPGPPGLKLIYHDITEGFEKEAKTDS